MLGVERPRFEQNEALPPGTLPRLTHTMLVFGVRFQSILCWYIVLSGQLEEIPVLSRFSRQHKHVADRAFRSCSFVTPAS